MTTTSTTDLAGILSAKKAEIVMPPTKPGDVVEIIEVTEHGEIVPGTAVEPASANATVPAVPAPVEPPADYSFTPAKVLGAIPFADGYWRMARRVCRTEFVPSGFRGNPEAIVAAFMRGYEMGFPPMQALDSFNVIQGKVGLTAEAMRALILNAGHDIILEDMSDNIKGDVTEIRAQCHRKQWPADKWATYTYSLEDARTAGLLGKDSWKKNPRAMLDARATSGAGRRYFADVLAGMSYTPEEIRDFSGPDQEVTPSPPAPAPTPANGPTADFGAVPETRSSPPVSTPTTPSSGQKAPEAPPSSPTGETPKRPRGRPRKAQSAPIAAPGRSASQTQAAITDGTAPESLLAVVPNMYPPEQTSLNTDGAIPAVAKPSEADIIREQLEVLKGMINTLPTVQQPLCRAFIRQHYPDGTADLKPADVQKCIDIAAGWPESAAQHPLTDELPF